MSTSKKETNAWDQDFLLKVEHMTMRFGGLVAIADLSFTAADKQITAIIGPNGAGKTTVFNCLTGFYKPTVGRITMRNRQKDIKRFGMSSRVDENGDFLLERMLGHTIARDAKISRTFQNIRLFGAMTVLENLIVAQHNDLMAASKFSLAGLLNLPVHRNAENRAIDRAKYWLDKVNLTKRADDPATSLPYGDQRRLEIIRAMCMQPNLLCLDEPAAGLNPRESSELNTLLKYIVAEHNIGLLLIEHDMSVVMGISDHIVVLDYGRKIADGTRDEVRSNPDVIKAYLGEDDEDEVA